MRHYRTAVGAAATMALAVVPATASADGGHPHGGDEPITTVATGLDGPRQLSDYKDHQLVVAESDSGEVSSVDLRSGEVETLLSGFVNAQGVDYDRGRLYVAVGEAGPPDEEEGAPPAEPPAEVPGSIVLEATPDGEILRTFDLLEYELENNPDGQVQFVDDENGQPQPVDALSNPFSVLVQEHRILVADAGANAVLSIDRESGEISNFFVPDVITDTPECEDAENNSPETVGCDPVPTEITEGPDGKIYVGSLAAESPDAARVYVLDHHGKLVDQIRGLTSITGVAVHYDGTVYASNLFAGAPEGEGPPPEGFDPSTIGAVTRISPDGTRAVAAVTMPTGLEIADGKLYGSAWSVAGFFDLPSRGEVQRIGDSAFVGTP